ncbi:MAG TPA: 5'-nucleotidase, partial [Thermoanaerobaculia bacterium]|nr:5'-nucleotidase [Thermoanaerobaculia bacterium]
RIELTFADHKVKSVRGNLVRVDASLSEDRAIKSRVRAMQRELEKDPKYRELFTIVAHLAAPLTVDELGARTVELMRDLTHADAALSTKSSFRQPLPSGDITIELLRAAMPYDNEIVVAEMNGEQLQKLLTTANESYVVKPQTIDPAKTYKVAATDYMARVAYRDFFPNGQGTGLRVREEFRSAVAKPPLSDPDRKAVAPSPPHS